MSLISERDSTLVDVRFSSSTSLDLLWKREFQSLEMFVRFLLCKLIAILRVIVGRGRLQRTPKLTLYIHAVTFINFYYTLLLHLLLITTNKN